MVRGQKISYAQHLCSHAKMLLARSVQSSVPYSLGSAAKLMKSVDGALNIPLIHIPYCFPRKRGIASHEDCLQSHIDLLHNSYLVRGFMTMTT